MVGQAGPKTGCAEGRVVIDSDVDTDDDGGASGGAG